MDCFRVFTDADGETHFEDIELTLKQTDELGKAVVFPRSEPLPASSIFFVHRSESAGPTPWHTVKQRQFVLRLAGEMEIEVSDGSMRRTPVRARSCSLRTPAARATAPARCGATA